MTLKPEFASNKKRFRVAIFGSARITKNDPIYDQVYNLAKLIAGKHFDVVTGGGPGLMDAASKGHKDGRTGNDSYSIGLNIKLPHEQKPNWHLDIKQEYNRFSTRLDTFMSLSNAIVVAPGGVGTLLEFVYTWQLVQVEHICDTPIILLGDQWQAFLEWVENHLLKHNFLDKKDLNDIFLAKDYNDAFNIITHCFQAYQQGEENICLNLQQYKKNYYVEAPK